MPRKLWVLAPFCLLLLIAGAIFVGCSDDETVGSVETVTYDNTVVIHTNPDYLQVPWSLAGPGGRTLTWHGDVTLEDVDDGEYTLTWLPVEGWTEPRPNPATGELGQMKQIDFQGEYFLEPGSIFLNAEPATILAPWSVTGPDEYSASGVGDATLTGLVPGEYEVIWETVPGFGGVADTTSGELTIYGLTFEHIYSQIPESIYVNPEPNEADAPWTVTGPDGYNRTGTGDVVIDQAWPDSAGDDVSTVEYTVTWGDAAGWVTPEPTTVELSRSGSPEAVGLYFARTGEAAIDIAPNDIDATWTLVGPGGAERSGTGDADLIELAYGDYTIYWSEVEAWDAPEPQSATLSATADLDFSATYDPSLVIDPQPEGLAAPWQLTRPGGSTLSGTGRAVFDDPGSGSYTVAWQAMDGWTTPAAETISFGTEGVIAAGEYTQDTMTLFVRPEPAGLGAPWEISGPAGFTASGSGQGTVEATASGVYTLIWGPVMGYTEPGLSRQTLLADGTATFRSRYLHEIDFVSVTGDEFVMGTRNEDCAGNDEEEHEVLLTKDILMQSTEVTNSEFVEVLQWAYDNSYVTVEGGRVYDTLDNSTQMLIDLREPGLLLSYADGVFSTDYPSFPVIEVSWYAAASYCDWLSMHQGLTRSYNHSNWLCNGYDAYNSGGFRLPTEAEWEFACRAGSDLAFHNVDTTSDYFNDCIVEDPAILDADCWYGVNSGAMPHEVSSRNPNLWGLFDMHGNVQEWCNDRYGSLYCGVTCPCGSCVQEDPIGPSMGDTRVVRGGHFFAEAGDCRSGSRGENSAANASGTTGFRIVITDPNTDD